MEDDLHLAQRAALLGSELALGWFSGLATLRHERKPDGSVVTAADRAVEAAVREALAMARPYDAILGEEHGGTGTSRRRWIIDPIDGTALFVDGKDGWLVLLALEDGDEIVAGVAVMPAQGRIWWAAQGQGAWEAPVDGLGAARHRLGEAPLTHADAVPRIGPARRLAVADGTAGVGVAGARLSVLPVRDDPDTGANIVPKSPGVVADLLAETPARPWSVHPPLLVARGDIDLAVQTGGQIWDFAATSLIVREAGGAYRSAEGGTRPAPGPSVFARDESLCEAASKLVHPA